MPLLPLALVFHFSLEPDMALEKEASAEEESVPSEVSDQPATEMFLNLCNTEGEYCYDD